MNIKVSEKVKDKSSYRLLTVLDKMIFTELLKTLLAVLFVIVIIIVSRKFIGVLTKAIEGSIANETVLYIVGLKIIVAVAVFLPASIFMAVLMVVGRMYRDQEMSAVASAGGGAGVIFRGVLLLVLPLTFVAAFLSMYVSPWAEAKMQILLNEDASSADIRGISAGRFTESSSGDLVFYVQDIDFDGLMHQVFVHSRGQGRPAVINAKQGRMQYRPGGLYLILEDGERIQGAAGDKGFVIEKFAEYGVRIEKKIRALTLDRDAIPTESLWGSSELYDIAEIQKRLSIPMGVLFLSFLAVPLAKLSPRGGVYGSLLFAFGIYFIYGNLLRVNQSWVMSGVIPPTVGYVWIDISLLVLGLILLLRLYGWQWIKLTLTGKAWA